jgi:acetate kinase
MGLTPAGGVVMGTRPGDLDPGILLYLLRQPGTTVDTVESTMNHDSGLKALGGINDMRALRSRAQQGSSEARLAIRIFCRSIIKSIAGMIALYGADALVFTGGIGEHDAASRAEIARAFQPFGLQLDDSANEERGDRPQRISAVDSRIAAYVIQAEEDRMIAHHVANMCRISLS